MNIITGDCLDVMRTFPDNHFSGIVTDPPYGLSFMEKEWDHEVPGKSYWKEALRITKPGSFLIAMAGTRKFHRLTCEIEEAGFQIRDCISWIYASGFPKSHNHFGANGYGTALKPSWEPCMLAMKPIEGTFKQNYEKWGIGGLNIDGCRVGQPHIYVPRLNNNSNLNDDSWKGIGKKVSPIQASGRWPSNLILDEESGRFLDEQSGILKSGQPGSRKKEWTGFSKGLNILDKETGIGDKGGASRFFYCAKSSSRERNEGFEKKGCNESTGQKLQGNSHPTVKPLALMRYLITLIAPPTNALILDPFAGSGSTIVAATELGIDSIGIEKDPEYAEIARARVAYAEKVRNEDTQMRLFT